MPKKITIIGSGVSGLSAALELCKRGFKPVIFEKNSFPGGYASAIEKNGFRFEMSLHFVSTAFLKVIDRLGLTNSVKMIDVKGTARIECNDVCSTDLYSYNDKAISYKKYLIKKYPEEKVAIEKLFGYGSSVEMVSDGITSGKHPVIALLSNPTALPFFLKYMRKTASQLLDDLFIDERLKNEISTLAILLGTPNDALSAVPYVQLATESYNKGAFYIEGGSQRLVRQMCSKIKKSGGRFFFDSCVSRFNIKNNTVESIVVNGKKIKTDVVLYCCDILNLQNNIAKGTKVFDRDLNDLPVAYSLHALHLGFDVDIKKIFGVDRSEYNIKTPRMSFNVAVYSNKDSTCCRKGTSTMTISIVESRFNEKLVFEILDCIWGGITSHITEKLLVTPRDLEKLTWNTGGSFGGFQSTPDHVQKQVAHATLVENLFVAGQWTGNGAGYINSMLGGSTAAKYILITKKSTTRNKTSIVHVLNFHIVVGKALKEGKIDAANVRNKKRWSAMERAWESIYGKFPGFPKDMNQLVTIYREMSVNDPEKIAREIFEGTRKPGQYWAFDDTGAGSYMQGETEEPATSNVRMEAEVPLKDIDPAETVIQNFLNPDECEAGLLTLDNLKLTKVEWMEQVEYEEGDEPHDVWHEVKNNGSRKSIKKNKAAARKKDSRKKKEYSIINSSKKNSRKKTRKGNG